jgi:hypothetical protein
MKKGQPRVFQQVGKIPRNILMELTTLALIPLSCQEWEEIVTLQMMFITLR